MTKKELIEGGWIDKYILGLTSELESQEVERLANIYPEVQADINRARSRICGKFNRNLTQPALRHSFLTKRRVLYGSAIIVFLLLTGLAFLYKAHCVLKDNYAEQSRQLAEDEAKLMQVASFSKIVNEQSSFLHADHTNRILLKGCASTPHAEAMVFHCRMSGKMMLRVIDLPAILEGQHYEVWAKNALEEKRLLGKIASPIRFDSLYPLDTALHFKTLQIIAGNQAATGAEPICFASVTK